MSVRKTLRDDGVSEMRHQRHICERSVNDGGMDDPRMLVYWYQQRMRAELLARARPRPWWSVCASAVSGAVRALTSPAAAPSASPAHQHTSAAPSAF